MKSLEPKSQGDRIYGIKLFRDDLDAIMDKLKEKLKDLTISDKSYSYESLDELAHSKGSKPPLLSLSSYSQDMGSVSLDFAKSYVFVYASPGPVAQSLWYELKAYLLAKVPWHYRVLNPWIWGTAFFFTSSIGSAIIGRMPSGSQLPTWTMWLLLILLLAWLLSLLNRRLAYGVRLVRRHEAGFLKRNSDQILVAIVSSIVGVLLTLAVQWLIKK